MKYLGLDDIVLIASKVLCMESEVLRRASRINGADSVVPAPVAVFDGVECHPGLVCKIAVLGYCLVRNHSFIDGNKRVAFLAMVEMAGRNEATWNESADEPDGDDTVEMMRAAAVGTIDEATFVRWVKTRVI